jgi:hypothetical protein
MEDDERALEIIGSTWAAVLEPIPDRFLDECFTTAAQDAADERVKIVPAMLLRAWGRLVGSGKVQLLGRGDLADCPHRCASGWIVKQEDGKEGVIPCPLHGPEKKRYEARR